MSITTRQISEQIEEIYSFECSEDLNSTYKKLNRQRSVFPSDKALLKTLYLSTLQATKKWYLPLRNWGKVYGEFAVMYEGRIPSSINQEVSKDSSGKPNEPLTFFEC